jgi:hypothetical protein
MLGRLNKGFKTFYGNQWGRLDYETHCYVGTKGEIGTYLTRIGFEVLTLDNKTKIHVRGRDMRVDARKKEGDSAQEISKDRSMDCTLCT